MYTQVLERGDIVYVDDGLISLKVIEKTVTTLTTSKFVFHHTSLIILFILSHSCTKWWCFGFS